MIDNFRSLLPWMKNSVENKMMQQQAGGQDSAVGTGQGAGRILMLHLCWAYWSKRCHQNTQRPFPAKVLSWASSCIQNWADPQCHWQRCNEDQLITQLLHLKHLLVWRGAGEIVFKNIGVHNGISKTNCGQNEERRKMCVLTNEKGRARTRSPWLLVRAVKMRIKTQLQSLKEMLGRGKEHKPTLDQEVSSGDIWVGPWKQLLLDS